MNKNCKSIMRHLGTGSDQHEPHIMPNPPIGPWTSDSMPWTVATTSQNGVMQFSALVPDSANKRIIFQKRKSEIQPPLPRKQFISEEKITAHFNGMHISNDYVQQNDNSSCEIDDSEEPSFNKKLYHSTSASSAMDYDRNNIAITSAELEEKLRNANRITMCEEIKKIQANASTSFMPTALLNRIEKPCTALVLWRPPSKLTYDMPANYGKNGLNSDTDENEDCENTLNYNSSCVGNNPQLKLETPDGMETEDL